MQMEKKGIPDEVLKLRNYIEANIRTTSKSGIEFIDPKQIKNEIHIKQNHVIFGRRGAGKSTLLKELYSSAKWSIYLNLEDYKDISFPNVLLFILIKLFNGYLELIRKNKPIIFRIFKYSTIKKQVLEIIKKLEILQSEPDDVESEITTNENTTNEVEASAAIKSDIWYNAIRGRLALSDSIQVKRKINENKLTKLKLLVTQIKDDLNTISKEIHEDTIFLILDDFYFIKLQYQPYLIDFIHRLTKDTNVKFKVGTIKHRSRLYIKDDTYIGIELRNDAIEIDLDYTFEEYDKVESFLKEILNYCIEKSGANISIPDMFAGEGFIQLCLASGGVPRDFLSLFVQVATKCIISGNMKIGKIQVTEEAIANLSEKINSLKRDTLAEDLLFETFIFELRRLVFTEQKTNCFLISKEQMETDEVFRQIIKELFDLRLIHLLDKNTSAAPSDGKRYEAYLLDLCLYENSRPQNFKQIDPSYKDEKSRKDNIRSSTRLNSETYLNSIKDKLIGDSLTDIQKATE